MKKIVSLLLVFIVCISWFPLLAFAQDVPGEYTNEEKETIYLRYTNNEGMLDAIFCDDTAVGYWNMVNDTEENGFLKWAIDTASKIIGEYPDKQDYAEILANLIMMQSGDIAEQVQNQSQYDNLKDGMDYAMDIVGIASDFVGGAHLLEEISPIIDAVTGGTSVIIDNVEQAKYYETTIKDYVQSKLFLEAVSSYAENEELRATASSLLSANDRLLQSRLEYLTDSSATLADYQAEFFVKNLSFELLKTANLYKTDETVKWYVDCGEKLSKSIQSIYSGTSFTFNMTMLAGDIGFGTSDTFNRYQEMKIVSDIAGAIVEANRHVQTPSRYDSPGALNIIQTKCDYYKMLIVAHARGEYLVYQLLINDAGLLSDFRALFDAFKDPGETTENWYSGQISVMLEYFDILNNMFVIEENTAMTVLENVPQDASEFNGHYYYVYNIDTGTTWEEAKQYCESQGGYLATITSLEEQAFITGLVQNQAKRSYWIGLTDANEPGNWEWVTEEPFSYSNWGQNEPNHGYGGKEHYVAIVSYDTEYDYPISQGEWNDHANDRDIGQFGFICEWGEYSTNFTPPSEDQIETNGAFGKYLAAVSKTTESGSWTEQLTLEADLFVTNGSSKTKTKMTLNSTSDVSNYIEGNLSNIQVSSISDMTIMGQTYAWSTEYQDGVAHYQYTEPVQTSQDLEIDPNFFDFDVITQEAIINEEISGNQLRFTISGDSMAAAGIAAVEQINGVDDLKYGDVEVTVTLSNLDTVETIVMVFDASMEYQGFNSDVSYHIQYRFV